MNYAYRGDHDLALQWLERAYQQHSSGLREILSEPVFRNDRYSSFLRKMNLPVESLRAASDSTPMNRNIISSCASSIGTPV